jgi:hypothetical protein
MVRSIFAAALLLCAAGCSAGTELEASESAQTPARADRYTPWCAEDGSIQCPSDFWQCGTDFVDQTTLDSGAPQDTAIAERRANRRGVSTPHAPFKPDAACGKPGAPTSCPRFCVLKNRRVPWCEPGSNASMPGKIHDRLACPHGWTCGEHRVGQNLLNRDDGAPNDVGNFAPQEDGAVSFAGPDCGKGGADDDTCPRFCVRQ